MKSVGCEEENICLSPRVMRLCRRALSTEESLRPAMTASINSAATKETTNASQNASS